MVITNDTWLPSEAELSVPQEITLSAPYFKAVSVYMHRNCEDAIKVSFPNKCCYTYGYSNSLFSPSGVHATEERG